VAWRSAPATRERQAPIKLGTQHLGVDEEADQALGFQARAVGVGHADADIALAAVAMQQAWNAASSSMNGVA
jgi:hypothetical protein